MSEQFRTDLRRFASNWLHVEGDTDGALARVVAAAQALAASAADGHMNYDRWTSMYAGMAQEFKDWRARLVQQGKASFYSHIAEGERMLTYVLSRELVSQQQALSATGAVLPLLRGRHVAQLEDVIARGSSAYSSEARRRLTGAFADITTAWKEAAPEVLHAAMDAAVAALREQLARELARAEMHAARLPGAGSGRPGAPAAGAGAGAGGAAGTSDDGAVDLSRLPESMRRYVATFLGDCAALGDDMCADTAGPCRRTCIPAFVRAAAAILDHVPHGERVAFACGTRGRMLAFRRLYGDEWSIDITKNCIQNRQQAAALQRQVEGAHGAMREEVHTWRLSIYVFEHRNALPTTEIVGLVARYFLHNCAKVLYVIGGGGGDLEDVPPLDTWNVLRLTAGHTATPKTALQYAPHARRTRAISL